MNKNRLITPEFCYWIGLVQSDGCLRKHYTNKRKKSEYIIDIQSKDLEHLKLFQQISSKLLKRHVKIHKINRTNKQIIFEIRIGVARLLKYFSDLEIDFSDPPKPPNWVINNIKLFGAYIAGVIDGDGSVRIKRPKNLQFGIRIISGKPQIDLQKYIRELFRCGCCIYKQYRVVNLNGNLIKGTSYNLEFAISGKNIQLFREYVLPWIQISRKRDKMESFIKMKWARPESNRQSPRRQRDVI